MAHVDVQVAAEPAHQPPHEEVAAAAAVVRERAPAEIPAANSDEPAHPADENVVVVSGALTFGNGDKLVKGAGNKTLGVGGYALVSANMNHFVYTGTAETTIVLYGIGPVEFKYVNPGDDPRNAKTPTR